jgi:prepilin-type N-terminal cleavage/methylation domain-containing protein
MGNHTTVTNRNKDKSLNMKILKGGKGYSLVEVLVALAILSIIGIMVPKVLQIVTVARVEINVRTTAENLATSQMEKIKASSYIAAQNGIADYSSTIQGVPSGYRFYTLDANNNIVSGKIYGLPWDISNNVLWPGTPQADPGVQKVTIIVESNAELNSQGVYKEIFQLTDFKVK